MSVRTPPEALMLLASQCSHCSQVAASLLDMLKGGELCSLKLVNLDMQPEVAEQLQVRSVPWLKIGDTTHSGLTGYGELVNIARAAGTSDSKLLQLNELLTDGQLNAARELVISDSTYLKAIMQVLENPGSKINVRVGVGAILEDMAGSPTLKEHAQDLVKLTKHSSATVRGDAAHYLGLTGSELSEVALRDLLNDENIDVREIAKDGLDELLDA